MESINISTTSGDLLVEAVIYKGIFQMTILKGLKLFKKIISSGSYKARCLAFHLGD